MKTNVRGLLIPLVQPELHLLAHYYMSRQRAGHTLQTTALVNEAYLQFVEKTQPRWQNRPSRAPHHYDADLTLDGGGIRQPLDSMRWRKSNSLG